MLKVSRRTQLFQWVILNKILIIYLLLSASVIARADERTISIIGVGDIMLGSNFPSTDYLPVDDGKKLLAQVNAILSDADITFGNLEGAILDQGPTLKTHCKKCYAFRMPEKLADNLVTAGFDLISIANNHIRDFGAAGYHNTLRVLNTLGIHAAGLISVPSVSFEREGIHYGFAAFAPNVGTVDIRDLNQAQTIVRQLAERNDIVIVSFHGGAEGPEHQHVTRKTEHYYGEDRGNVYAFAHKVIDAGADIVFGHGPHVSRAVERYRDRFIAYSLGNFCTYGRFSLKGPKGFAPIIKVEVTPQGEFVTAQIIPIIQHKWGAVTLDPQKQALERIRQLTHADFPEGTLHIDNDGVITEQQSD